MVEWEGQHLHLMRVLGFCLLASAQAGGGNCGIQGRREEHTGILTISRAIQGEWMFLLVEVSGALTT